MVGQTKVNVRATMMLEENVKGYSYWSLSAILFLVLVSAGCKTSSINGSYPDEIPATVVRPAVTLLLEDNPVTPRFKNDPKFLGEDFAQFFWDIFFPMWEYYSFHADKPRADIVRNAFMANFISAGLPAVYRSDMEPDYVKDLPDGHLIVSTQLRKVEVSTTFSFVIPLVIVTVVDYKNYEANVILDCRISSPGSTIPLWHGTVEGKAGTDEMGQDLQVDRQVWVVQQATDRAIQAFMTQSGIQQTSARLRNEAFARALKANLDAQTAGNSDAIWASFGQTYKVADTEERARSVINAITQTTRKLSVKPALPEEARRYGVQAYILTDKKQYKEGIDKYDQALNLAPWWAEGHFNRALTLANLDRYQEAMTSMKQFLMLAPNAPDARAAQDKIYEWELKAKSPRR